MQPEVILFHEWGEANHLWLAKASLFTHYWPSFQISIHSLLIILPDYICNIIPLVINSQDYIWMRPLMVLHVLVWYHMWRLNFLDFGNVLGCVCVSECFFRYSHLYTCKFKLNRLLEYIHAIIQSYFLFSMTWINFLLSC
jgi:hypothetical protein